MEGSVAAAPALPAVVESGALAAYRSLVEVNEARARIAQLMKEALTEGVHYGKVTAGASAKPSLWQPGAELICFTFRIANEHVRIDDLSVKDERGRLLVVRYRIVMRAVHAPTGTVLAEGVGECSSDEEKYAWRRATCDEEFDATPEWDRRIKFYKRSREEGGGVDPVKQVRQNPADMANTVLKMADKRAYVATTLHATAASDFFTQDMDDEEIARALSEADAARGSSGPGPVQQPRETPAANGTAATSSGASSRKRSAPAASSAPSGTAEDGVINFRAFVENVAAETKTGRPKPGEKEGREYTIVRITLGQGVGEGLTLTTFNKAVLDVASSAKAKGEMIEGTAKRGKWGIDIQGNVDVVIPSPADAAAASGEQQSAGAADTAEGGELAGI